MIFIYFCPAPLAQLVEHMTLNHQVAGSSPAGCTLKRESRVSGIFFLMNTLLGNETCSPAPQGALKSPKTNNSFFSFFYFSEIDIDRPHLYL